MINQSSIRPGCLSCRESLLRGRVVRLAQCLFVGPPSSISAALEVSWRMPPRHFPPWNTVHSQLLRWRDDGTLQRLHNALRDMTRAAAGRAEEPAAAIVESQTARADDCRGTERGYAGGKTTTGRKTISSWIQPVSCSWPTFKLPTSTTRSARGRWSRPRRHRPCRDLTWSEPVGLCRPVL